MFQKSAWKVDGNWMYLYSSSQMSEKVQSQRQMSVRHDSRPPPWWPSPAMALRWACPESSAWLMVLKAHGVSTVAYERKRVYSTCVVKRTRNLTCGMA